ncbi:hypothetical protein PV327_010640 [Microctonus hyperodae]|uniref:Ionotropic glutamate receptor L-glutamate and glycine-binding domain-containing protein n=1 Tax=Microctonus hyperodae TaxID=165561 RepID=A0AA39FSD3_MICHY|nr:hypothetical protein PV327_010640 [Microctonus hyperodae]
MYDERIFNPGMNYIWNRIINAIFIHQFNSFRQKSGKIIRKEWVNLESISYPIDTNDFITTYHIDTWYNGKFRNGRKHFFNKTVNLKRKILQVAVFEHIPAVTKQWRKMHHHDNQNSGNEALGIEIEIIKIIAEKINFRSLFYRLPNINIDKWDESNENGNYSGLLGETMEKNANFLIGDFHYTLRHHRILELSYPYNTECLTFITPESLTQNSWMLLIIPFKLYTWIAVILLFLVAAYILNRFSLFYQKQIMPFKRNTFIKGADIQISNVAITILKRTENLQKQNNINEQLKSLQLFTDVKNSMLYTYGMLLQVSLPRLPKAWALRLFIGWWWLYSILITVAYRASMTASLANPVAKNLHIMKECVILMPISIGMNRNSPLKPQVDQLVRNVVESGLVEKWLSDVMEWSKIAEIRYESDAPKALVDLYKLYGALIALGIGYLLGFISLIAENLYWKYVVMKNPAYDKYQMDTYYATNKTNI